LSIV
jgi:small-conductance mechanosensitive channel